MQSILKWNCFHGWICLKAEAKKRNKDVSLGTSFLLTLHRLVGTCLRTLWTLVFLMFSLPISFPSKEVWFYCSNIKGWCNRCQIRKQISKVLHFLSHQIFLAFCRYSPETCIFCILHWGIGVLIFQCFQVLWPTDDFPDAQVKDRCLLFIQKPTWIII